MSGETVSQSPNQKPQKSATELERLFEKWSVRQIGPSPYELYDEAPDTPQEHSAEPANEDTGQIYEPVPTYRAVDAEGVVVAEEVDGEIEIPEATALFEDGPDKTSSDFYDGYIPEDFDKAA